MTNQQLKDQLGQTTKKLEAAITPFYTSLEPHQRGLLILGLLLFLLLIIYYLSKPNPHQLKYQLSQKEKDLEQRILRQMAFYKRLKND